MRRRNKQLTNGTKQKISINTRSRMAPPPSSLLIQTLLLQLLEGISTKIGTSKRVCQTKIGVIHRVDHNLCTDTHRQIGMMPGHNSTRQLQLLKSFSHLSRIGSKVDMVRQCLSNSMAHSLHSSST